MRCKRSVEAITKSLTLLLILGLTAYGTRFALGDSEPPSAPSSTNHPALAILDEDGAEIYMTRCMSCHQMNGRGVPGVFPPLNGTEWVNGDKGRLIRITLHGLTGEISVGDETYSGAMPPWKSFLDDEQMSAVLTYVRSSWGNEASEVTSEEVAIVRAATEDRREPWTEAELLEDVNMGIPGAEDGDTSGQPEATDSDADSDNDTDVDSDSDSDADTDPDSDSETEVDE